MSSKDVEEENTKSESDDETTHVPGSMVESSKKKELKKFYFVTESEEHVHLTKEQISAQNKIEEEAKAEAARHESKMRKEEPIDILGPELVNKYYNDKLQYDRYCDKMLNRRENSRITNCDILTRKGLITLKVYREDDSSEIIPEFKAIDLHLGEWREVMTTCPNKKGKGPHQGPGPQGPGLDDHAITFNSFLLAEIDKRNLNPLKQMRVIEQLRQ
ncbi:hypothetical protein Tco_0002874 [Tanacetum coccineum]